MSSVVGIWNRALQKLGAREVSDISENSVNADACRIAYEALLPAELRSRPWRFAIQRFSLAADATAPAWGKANSYTLPTGFLKLITGDDIDLSFEDDFEEEGGKLLTDKGAPLKIRGIVLIEDPNLMDPLFKECLATKMAFELCEVLTQSNTKKEALREDYKAAVLAAAKANSFSRRPQEQAEDTWLSVRR